MNANRRYAPPSTRTINIKPILAPPRATSHSSRATPFSTITLTTTASQNVDAMLARPLISHPPPGSMQSHYSLDMPNVHPGERDARTLLGSPYDVSPSQETTVRVRRLPLDISNETLRAMAVWSRELLHCYVLAADQSEDDGFCSAIMVFKTMQGAKEAKSMLDGRVNFSGTGEMIVQIQSASHGSPSASSSTSTSHHSQSRFASFQSMDGMHPQSNGSFVGHDYSGPDHAAHYHNLFSPQSPIGNHLTDRNIISGKAMINNDYDDDEETADLLNDPVAYAKKAPATQRRATAPQLPNMSLLSLNGNENSSSASVASPFGNGLSDHMDTMATLNGFGQGMHHPSNAQAYSHNHLPPINPADQNPPCNTLYVGNLPMNATEAELKKIFMPQRGYKRLCFRAKHNGPMCFVEFEDITFATKALKDLYGKMLPSSNKGGIRVSFSKNPLGVRSAQSGPSTSSPMNGMNGIIGGPGQGFITTNGPPPGLSAPPGLGPGRGSQNGPPMHGNQHYFQNSNGGYNAGPNFMGHETNYNNVNGNHNGDGFLNGSMHHGINGYSHHTMSPNGHSVPNGNGPRSNHFSLPPPHMLGR